MQIIVLMTSHRRQEDITRKYFAIVIIFLDMLLFLSVIRMYFIPNKADLKESEHDEYFKKNRSWNWAITFLSALIFVIEIVGESLEKDGIIGQFIKQFY